MRIDKYLDDVMRAHGFKRDKELAVWLGVSAAAISQYRSGVRSMDNEKCVQVALELGIDPTRVIMATDMDRAERSGQKSLWEVFSQRMTAPASIVLATLFATNFLSPSTAEAASRLASQQNQETRVCVM